MSQLETNTTSLQTLLDKVNALPDAGGGEDVTEETNTYTNLLTDLETAIEELPDAGGGGGSVGIVTGEFTATSEMGDEPGVQKVILTSDTLAASSRTFIAILYDYAGNPVISNFLYRFAPTDNWSSAMGGAYALNNTSIVVNDTMISGNGAFASSGTYLYIAG